MKYRNCMLAVIAATMLGACSTMSTIPAASSEELKQQVINTERAFAKTMADRDFNAFATFVSNEAIFFAGGEKQLRGKQAVLEWWKDFYSKPQAPFSWEPETVEVLPSGTLALSSGPVHNAEGKLIGTFSSIWRQESKGTWRIVFDKGNAVCN